MLLLLAPWPGLGLGGRLDATAPTRAGVVVVVVDAQPREGVDDDARAGRHRARAAERGTREGTTSGEAFFTCFVSRKE